MAKRDIASLVGLGIAGYVLYRLLTTHSVSGSLTEQASNFWDDTMNALTGNWKTAGNAPEYLPYLNDVEAQYGIPTDLLARVAYQESHFRDDIISGAVKSPAGAVGMFQLMPQYYPNAGQSWQSDAVMAANALGDYYRQFGDWQLALAAYNDGPGNLNAILAGTKTMPTETQKYVSQITADVPVTGSLVA